MAVTQEQFLAALVERARKVDGNDNMPLTAERYLVAVIDTILKPSLTDEPNKVDSLRKLLTTVFPDLEPLRQNMMNYIENPSTMAYLDDFYMKKRLAEAESRANLTEGSVLTAELVLKCVLENPTPAIRKYLSGGGESPKDQPIIPGGPDGYFSTLPVKAMIAAISESGLPAAISNTAGTFVCNDVLYSLLHHYAGTGTRCGFIHVPWLPEQGEPSLSLESTAKALEIAVSAL